MADTTSLPHDIPDPAPLLPGIDPPAWLWALGALAILSLILLLFFRLLRRRPKPEPDSVEETYESSRQELEALRARLGDCSLAEIATEASFSIRRYLATCLDEPALYETHEELVLRDDALSRLPAGSREHLNPLLALLAKIKYAPSGEDSAVAATLIENCLSVLHGIESTRPRRIE